MEQPINVDIRHDFPTPSLPKIHLTPADYRNGIVVRVPDSLSGATMALPALRQLKGTLPRRCGLFVIAPAAFLPLYGSFNFIDLILPLADRRHWHAQDFRQLRRLRAGVGLLFNQSASDALKMRGCGIRFLFGAAAAGPSLFLRKSFKFPGRRSHSFSRQHLVNRYSALAETLGAPPWDGVIPQIDSSAWLERVDHPAVLWARHPKLLVLGIGATSRAKLYPAASFREVARFWIEHGGAVALVGRETEQKIAAGIREGLPARRVADLTGKTDLLHLLILLKHARCAVSNDNGIPHLCSLLGIGGIVIFGPSDYSRNCPVRNNWKIFFSREQCSPCFRQCCPSGLHRCMNNLAPETVTAALAEYL